MRHDASVLPERFEPRRSPFRARAATATDRAGVRVASLRTAARGTARVGILPSRHEAARSLPKPAARAANPPTRDRPGRPAKNPAQARIEKTLPTVPFPHAGRARSWHVRCPSDGRDDSQRPLHHLPRGGGALRRVALPLGTGGRRADADGASEGRGCRARVAFHFASTSRRSRFASRRANRNV